jgi:DNA-binding NarL/FixJ family response regulator
MTPIRVVIADDHPVFRKGLRRVLDGSGQVEVVGEAAEGRAALDCVRRLRPQVAIVDLHMPRMHGLELTGTICRELPDIGVLVLTMSEDDATVWAALRAGARGYLLKSAEEEGIVRAVRAVAEGELVIGPGVARRVLGFFDRPAPSPADDAFPGLTQRERDVLEQLAQGLPNTAIARRLGLTPKTVRNYVSAILLKLQVADRAAAIGAAREAGVGDPRPDPGIGPQP